MKDSALSNGHGNASAARLYKLLAEREGDVAAIKRTIALMNGALSNGNGAAPKGGATVLADALALDAARRTKRKGKGRKAKSYKADRLARRTATAAFLAHIAKHGTAPDGNGKGVGTLMRHGFVRKTKSGYVRTDKPFEV